MAQYRAGDWEAAIEALTKSTQLQQSDPAYDWLFLAMAHWQLGNKAEARTWREKAVSWLEESQRENSELDGFRAEADELLGGSEN